MKGFKPDPDGIEAEVRKQQQRGADRVKATGEVFTPMPLCREMVAEIPLETKQDPYATFLDPSCGDGNFLVALLEELSKFHDPYWAFDISTKKIKEERQAASIKKASTPASASALGHAASPKGLTLNSQKQQQ